ncbi:MAG: hypothetical protein P9M14_02135 [Candidatus Alcyoniella australis]|nr:hypothetical protein [Candidatus Alcyoniella australis]
MPVRRNIALLLLTILIGAMVICLASCGDDSTDEMTVEEIIAHGKKYLTEGKGLDATQAFEAALVRAPDNADAKFGLVLSNLMQLTSIIDELIDLLGNFGMDQGMDPLLDGFDPLEDGSDFSRELQMFIDKVALAGLRQADQMYIELQQLPDPTFSIDSYVLYLGSEEPLLSWSGELDGGELHFLGALNSILLGAFDLVLAHELDIDINDLSLPVLPEAGDDDDGGDPDALLDENTIATIDVILEWLYDFLNDPKHPNLLYLDGDGVERMQASGRELGSGVLRLMALIDYTQAEARGEGGADGNVFWDETRGLVLIPKTLEIEPALVEALRPLLLNLNETLFDGTPFDIDPALPNPLDIAAANQLLIYFGLFDEPLLPYGLITIDVGIWFQDPAPDGLRSLVFSIIDIWDLVKQLLEMF